jgi:hypothetical protein
LLCASAAAAVDNVTAAGVWCRCSLLVFGAAARCWYLVLLLLAAGVECCCCSLLVFSAAVTRGLMELNSTDILIAGASFCPRMDSHSVMEVHRHLLIAHQPPVSNIFRWT